MNNILHIYKTAALVLLTSLLSVEVTSTQEGSSYYFYQQPQYPRDCTQALDQCSSDNYNGVYTIKPDGYPQPFEVYCNNEISSGGWTVIQRQIDGSLTFRRNWEDYKTGFGFLSSEFWIGLDRLSYLTNQAVYGLRIDIVLSNGSTFFVNYNSFRISDEFSEFTIVSTGEFHSNWSCIVSVCPPNTTHDSCTCQNLCTDLGQTDCYTDCIETCVPEGCFVPETNSYISNGESVITADCSQNCTCIDNQLSCTSDYECSTDATCTVKDETRKCYCNEGFEGDGETCIRNSFTDCYDAYQAGHTTDRVYAILPTGWTESPFNVFCNMTFNGGGWTVFQRRTDGVTDFYRYWEDYKRGFGSLDPGNDFWLGNEKLHYLTNQRDYMVRIDLVSTNNQPSYHEYASFKIGNESTKYQLSVNSFIGGGSGDELNGNNGGKFSTRDQDNDGCTFHDCAKGHKGGWWYSTAVYTFWCQECCYSSGHCGYYRTRSSCYNVCTDTNPNGDYNGGDGENIYTDGCHDKFVEMKIRPFST